jgi:hypothetical protein
MAARAKAAAGQSTPSHVSPRRMGKKIAGSRTDGLRAARGGRRAHASVEHDDLLVREALSSGASSAGGMVARRRADARGAAATGTYASRAAIHSSV